MQRRLPVRTAALAALACAAFAEQTVRDHVITVDDYATLNYLASSALSPDGKSVAYIERRWEQDLQKRNADLWVVKSAGGDPVRTLDLAQVHLGETRRPALPLLPVHFSCDNITLGSRPRIR